jgi:hypothetical protein
LMSFNTWRDPNHLLTPRNSITTQAPSENGYFFLSIMGFAAQKSREIIRR